MEVKNEKEISSVDILIKHTKIFTAIIGSLFSIIIAILTWVYIDHIHRQQSFNEQQIELHNKITEKMINIEVSTDCIKRYILLRDGVDINKIEDERLWDELIMQFREKSDARAVKIKKYIDDTINGKVS